MTRTRLTISLLTATALTGLIAAPALADRALVIGIDHYADQRLSSGNRAAAGDAATIANMLTSSLGYQRDDILTLTDARATGGAIRDGFQRWLIDGTRPGERVFLYFAGQGYFIADADNDEADGLDEVILPHDATVAASGSTIGNGISDDELRSLAQALDGRQVTMVIDAGHAGLVSADGATGATGLTRAVSLPGTRAIVVEPRVQSQKAEGAPLDTDGLSGNVAVFSATSGAQAPVVDDGGGAFTQAFVEAVTQQSADANGNGTVSNAEILAYVRKETDAACQAYSGCATGLTPTLGPAKAAAGSPYAGDGYDGVLTADAVLDHFAAGYDHRVTIEQLPHSPVRVGTRDIRFRVTSPFDGNLILLDVSDKGRLVQLFPNQFTADTRREGVMLAGSPITIPDDYYGIKFNATEPSSGTLIALVTHEPITLPAPVKTRKIEVIARDQANDVYLPAIVEALEAPVDTATAAPTRALGWSVATLKYEIIP